MLIPEPVILGLALVGVMSIACMIAIAAPQAIYKVKYGVWRPSVEELQSRKQLSELKMKHAATEKQLQVTIAQNSRLEGQLQDMLNKLARFAGVE